MKEKENASPYLVYARKFRPQGFDEVVGQEPIVRTLKNSIEQGRIPQNFLFSGPRGVGKTSTARILSKALNCEKGPTGEPCDQCVSCKEITQGNSMDVLEIDGASNRGIDEVRSLRETVKFKPVSGRYKIYIIDEVHMLTTEAFNALLKTLEEPPPHVKFIFATTESHKVPLTILSRCQRYNFKRIPTGEMVKKLDEIAKKEKIKVDTKALFLIAKASDGALRDAEGLLDQLVSFSEGKIEEVDVLQILGLAPETAYFQALDAIRSKDVKVVFALVRSVYDDGVDLMQFLKGIFEVFRHLLLFQCTESPEEFIDMSEDGMKLLKDRKNQFSRGELFLGLNILTHLQNQMRRNLGSPKLLLETALLKLLHVDQLKQVEKLIAEGGVAASLPKSPGNYTPSSSAPAFRQPAAESPKPLAYPPISSGSKPQSFQAVSPAAVVDAPSAGAAFTLQEIETVWPRVIEYVKQKRMSHGIFLSESQPVDVSGVRITLGFPPEFQFHKEMLEKDQARKLVEEGFEVALARKISLSFVITQLEQKEFPMPALERSSASPEDGKLPEIITEAMGIFEGAKIIRKDP